MFEKDTHELYVDFQRPHRARIGWMQYRRLGKSGLRVSELSLGTMTFGTTGESAAVLGSTTLAEARRQVDVALDAGVNLIDTADVYAGGASEEFVGEAIRGRRERLLVATKARFSTGPGTNDAGLSRHHLLEACDASLRRLGVDHIDLYQMHQWDGQTPIEETLATLDSLVRSGKVRYLGCSNFSAWHVAKAIGVSERLGFERYVAQQIHYSLLAREAEYELVPLGLHDELGILVWSPLAGGLLSGKYRRDLQISDARWAAGWDEPPICDWEHVWRIIEVLVEVGEAHGVSAAQVALRYLLDKPGVTSVVVGARTVDQLADNLRSTELRLPDEVRIRLDELSRPPLVYPYWHQASNAFDRLSEGDLTLLRPYIDR